MEHARRSIASIAPETPEEAIAAHGKPSYRYIGNVVYGGLDGIITTFAVVSGVAGAQLGAGVVLILGVANLLADGISMATGAYLSNRSEREYYDRERQREQWQIGQYPAVEQQVLRDIYARAGYTMTAANTPSHPGAQTTQARYFPETGHTVGGRFLQYWQANGGLAVFGYPLTDELKEQGRTVQYFERQRFEYHPEQPRPYDSRMMSSLADLVPDCWNDVGSTGVNSPPRQGKQRAARILRLTQHNPCNRGILTTRKRIRCCWGVSGLSCWKHKDTNLHHNPRSFAMCSCI